MTAAQNALATCQEGLSQCYSQQSEHSISRSSEIDALRNQVRYMHLREENAWLRAELRAIDIQHEQVNVWLCARGIEPDEDVSCSTSQDGDGDSNGSKRVDGTDDGAGNRAGRADAVSRAHADRLKEIDAAANAETEAEVEAAEAAPTQERTHQRPHGIGREVETPTRGGGAGIPKVIAVEMGKHDAAIRTQKAAGDTTEMCASIIHIRTPGCGEKPG